MVSFIRRQGTLALSLLGVLVLAAAFLLLANTNTPTRSVELGIADRSPLGASGGVVVPASCASYDHTSGGQCSPCPNGQDYNINGTCQDVNTSPQYPLLDQPTMNGPVCSAGGTQVSLSWGPVTGAEVYALRVDDRTNNSAGCMDGWYCDASRDFIIDTLTSTSYTKSVIPGKSYLWWVHGKYASTWEGTSGSTQLAFTCMAPPASMSATCNADHATAALSWAASTGATSYNLRFNYPTAVSGCPAGWTLFTDGRTCYINNYTGGTSITIPVSSGVTHDAWVHSIDADGWVSDAKHVPGDAFTCNVTTLPEPAQIAPLSGTVSCGANGTTATLSWNPVTASGATYAPRYSGSSVSSCPSGWYSAVAGECDIDDQTATSVTVPTVPGATYQWWVHAKYPGTWNGLSTRTIRTFTCSASTSAPTCTISANPTSTTSGGAVTLTKTSSNATSATLNDGVTTVSTATSGTTTVNPTAPSTTYTMAVTGAGGVTGACTTTVTTTGSPGSGTISVTKSGASVSAYAKVSDPNGTWPAIPTSFTNTPVGTHTVYFTYVPGHTHEYAICTGSGCTPSGYTNITSSCDTALNRCSVTVPVNANETKVLDVKYTATSGGGTPTIACSASSVAPGGSISGVVSGGTSSTDWVAVFAVGVSDSNYNASGASPSYRYVSLPRPQTVSFTAPTVTGNYQLRVFQNNGSVSVNSCSFTVTTTPTSCTPDASSPQTQTLSCPAGQTGSITQTRTSTCAAGATSPTWSAWSTTSNTCTSSSPGAVMIKRVGSDLTTSSVPAGTYAALDNASWAQTNPYVYSGATVGSHTADFTDISGYTESVGTCTYTTGGTECSVSTFGTTPTCDGSRCYVSISVSSGVTTKVAVQYTANITGSCTGVTGGTGTYPNCTCASGYTGTYPNCTQVPSSPGTVMIKRVGSDLTTNTAPTGTYAALDNVNWIQTNPFVYSGATVGSHTADFTDISGYTESVGTCTYTTGGTECSVSTFGTTPTCDGSRCYVSISVTSGVTTKVAVQYLSSSAGTTPSCTITPSSTAVPYGGGYASFTTSASNASYGYFDGSYMPSLNGTQSPYDTYTRTHTMTVWNSTGTVSGSCSASVTVCAQGQTVSNNACVTPASGAIMIKRVGSDLTTTSAPSGTYAATDAAPSTWVATNPATFSGISTGSHAVYVTNVSGYTVTAGTCTYTTGGSECSVSSFSASGVSCSGSSCTIQAGTVSANATTKVAVQYVAGGSSALTCSLTPNPGAVAYGGGNVSFTLTSSNATYGSFDGAYTTSLSGTKTAFVSNPRTVTMRVNNDAGQYYDCPVVVSVCAQGQTVSNGVCVTGSSAPTCTISANPTSTTSGGSVTLTKSSTNATSATLNGVSTATSGTQTVNPTTTTTYTMSVSGAGGSGSCSTTVTVAGSGTGSFLIKRVGSDLTTTSAPSGTYAATDANPSGWTASNPATFSNMTVGTHSIYVTDVTGYTETAGACQYLEGGTECSVTSFGSTSTCNGSSCTFSGMPVNAGYVTKVAVQYTASATPPGGPLTIACSTSSVVPSGAMNVTVGGGSSTTDWVGAFRASDPTSFATFGTAGSNPDYWYVPIPRPATLTFNAPNTPGNYEMRVQSNNSYTTVASCPFTVTGSASCPAGYGGTYPNCTCPSGYTGTYPNCTPPSSCPAGYGGTYPNCTCPSGYTGTYPNCTPPSGSTSGLMIKRVDANSNVLSVSTTAYVDSSSNSTTANPATFSGLTPGSHTAYFADLSGYTETLGVCSYANGGTECSVSSFPMTPSCNGTTCSSLLTLTAGVTTKVAVRYAQTTGAIMVKRVDINSNTISGTTAIVDGSSSSANPATFSSLSTTGTHAVSFTDTAGYTETVGTCSYVTGGTECSVSSFPTTPTCNGTTCSLSAMAVTAGQTTKVAVKYTQIGNPTITLIVPPPGSTRVHSGDTVTITWNVTNATGWSCALTGPNVSGSGFSGTTSTVIVAQSTFTLTCSPPTGSGLTPVSRTLTVMLLPSGSEI